MNGFYKKIKPVPLDNLLHKQRLIEILQYGIKVPSLLNIEHATLLERLLAFEDSVELLELEEDINYE